MGGSVLWAVGGERGVLRVLSQYSFIPSRIFLPRLQDEGQEDVSLLETKQFPNALRVSGLCHVADNVLGSCLQSMKCWKAQLPKMRVLESLLKNPMYKERFLHTCVDKEDQPKLKFKPSLKNLRWQSVLEFSTALVRLEGLIRRSWASDKFGAGRDQTQGDVTVSMIDEVIRDPSFWACCHLICAWASGLL